MLETTHAEPEGPVRMNLRVLFSLANFLYTDERINYTVSFHHKNVIANNGTNKHDLSKLN